MTVADPCDCIQEDRMGIGTALGFFLITSALTALLKYLLRPRMADPLPEVSLGDPYDPRTPAVCTIFLKLLELKHTTVFYHDRLFWQIPAWVFAVGAVVLAADAG